jgi:DNA repair protein RadC
MAAPKKGLLREIEVRYKTTEVDDAKVNKRITGAKTVVDLFADLQNETKEKFIVVNLDTRGKIICFEVVAIGSVNAIYLRPMEVFRTSIIVNAASVVLVHNHPSGEPDPSAQDILFTEKCQRVADDLGLKLHDHVIIGYKSWYSFAEKGRM